MLKILKERMPETITEYFIEFFYKDDPDAGFCFPANRDNTPALDKMPPDAVKNYYSCLTDIRLTGAEFRKITRAFVNPAIGRCSCGKEVVLDGGYEGATQCECGKWYNLFGQSLIDPKYWYRDDDDYYSDTED